MLNNQRLQYLDVLRGIAAFLVVVQHVWISYIPSGYTKVDYLLNLLPPGEIGVFLFFWISGYVITYSVWDLKDCNQFAVGRFFRLYPIYWSSIIFVLILSCAIHQTLDWSQVLLNLTMFQRFLGIHDLLGVYWTLQVELMFYVYIYFCLKFGKIKSGKVFVCGLLFVNVIGLVCALARFLLDKKFPIAPFMGLSIILFSSIYFQHMNNKFLTRKQFLALWFTNFAMFCFISILGYQHDWGYGETPERFVICYLLVALLFVFSKKIFAKLVNKYFIILGAISYPLYLFHELINNLLSYYINKSTWYNLIIINISIILCAYIMHFYVELPGIKFKKYFIKRAVN